MDDDILSTGELAERQGYTGRYGDGEGQSGEPDVLLDVPELRVEEIILDVEDLRAHVSVQADVLNLLRLSVGADVQLGGVHLEIKGVEAQVLLKVRLDRVAEIINRVLATIDRNPEIVDQIVPPVVAVADQLETAAAPPVDELAGDVRSAAPDLEPSLAETIGESGEAATTVEEQAAAKSPQHEAGSAATVEEQAAAIAPRHEAGSAAVGEGTPRSLLRRRKQQHNPEEPPP
jgi:hypothetical protein